MQQGLQQMYEHTKQFNDQSRKRQLHVMNFQQFQQHNKIIISEENPSFKDLYAGHLDVLLENQNKSSQQYLNSLEFIKPLSLLLQKSQKQSCSENRKATFKARLATFLHQNAIDCNLIKSKIVYPTQFVAPILKDLSEVKQTQNSDSQCQPEEAETNLLLWLLQDIKNNSNTLVQIYEFFNQVQIHPYWLNAIYEITNIQPQDVQCIYEYTKQLKALMM
ncbi:Hypothetical_protein [Hexamita inflata]|uniref:Hypothetical_protein n=1 Tax=Hexamita inflata TaxID=28002 RepID=A0AA86RVD6_9EUKA|nr:Hypothetical protein HINF_LOCUS60925 [Hexamita inflata]